MTDLRVLLLDRDASAASVLLNELRRAGIASAELAAPDTDLPETLAHAHPHVVLLNHDACHPKDLLGCCAVRLLAPATGIGVIAAGGTAFRTVSRWAGETGCVDAVIESPLVEDTLAAEVRRLAERRAPASGLDASRIANLLPDGALDALGHGRGEREELFDAAVLFTDIRRSSDVAARTSPREFFAILNRSLSAQSVQVRAHEGAVVKYTGDGVMAVFRGARRARNALRCALAMAASAAELPFGIGVAQGEVLAGLVGDSAEAGARRQYDVIGATVHLAARLCDLASAGEVIATRTAYAAAGLDTPALALTGTVTVRGFDAPVDCVTLPGGPTRA